MITEQNTPERRKVMDGRPEFARRATVKLRPVVIEWHEDDVDGDLDKLWAIELGTEDIYQLVYNQLKEYDSVVIDTFEWEDVRYE